MWNWLKNYVGNNPVFLGVVVGSALGLLPTLFIIGGIKSSLPKNCKEMVSNAVAVEFKDHCCKCSMTELNQCGRR